LSEGIKQRRGRLMAPVRLTPYLGVSPTAAPEEVQYEEPAEEDTRDYYEEPYDAKKKIECIQSSL
jgi:hypothetical protein